MEKRNPLKIYENENQQIVSLSDGKIPPQAIDLEEAVIGAMLIDEKGVNEVIDILSPEFFIRNRINLFLNQFKDYLENQNQLISNRISDLKKNKNFEVIGGDFYLITFLKSFFICTYWISLKNYSAKIYSKETNSISNEISKSYNESTDVIDLLDEAESKLYDIAQNNIKGSSETAQNLVIQAKNRIEDLKQGVLVGYQLVLKN